MRGGRRNSWRYHRPVSGLTVTLLLIAGFLVAAIVVRLLGRR
ncbi:hypothetical protein [Lentzea indica]|nr:hypothetical protein [Lentzea indica]